METVQERLAELKKARGAKKLDGKAYDKDTAAIHALEAEIAAENEAETERINRERQAAAEAADRERQAKLAQLEAMIADDLQDIVEAEAGLRQAAAAFSRMINRNLQITKLANDIRLPIPAALGRFELERRLGCLISAVMSTVSPNHRHRFGATNWFPGVYKADTSWRQVAVKFYETLLQKELS